MGEVGEGSIHLLKNSKQNKKFKTETKTFVFSCVVNGVLMIGQNMVTLAVFFPELILSKIVQGFIHRLCFLFFLLMMDIKFLLLVVISFRARLRTRSLGAGILLPLSNGYCTE